MNIRLANVYCLKNTLDNSPTNFRRVKILVEYVSVEIIYQSSFTDLDRIVIIMTSLDSSQNG